MPLDISLVSPCTVGPTISRKACIPAVTRFQLGALSSAYRRTGLSKRTVAPRASGPSSPVTSPSRRLPGPTGHHDTTVPVALRARNAAPARLLDGCLDGCRTPGPRFSRRGAAFHSAPSAVFIQLGAR